MRWALCVTPATAMFCVQQLSSMKQLRAKGFGLGLSEDDLDYALDEATEHNVKPKDMVTKAVMLAEYGIAVQVILAKLAHAGIAELKAGLDADGGASAENFAVVQKAIRGVLGAGLEPKASADPEAS